MDVAVKLVRVNTTPGDQEDFLGEAELLLDLEFPSMLKVHVMRHINDMHRRFYCLGTWGVHHAQAVVAGDRVHEVQGRRRFLAKSQESQCQTAHTRVVALCRADCQWHAVP